MNIQKKHKKSRRLNPLREARSLVAGCGLLLTLLAAVVLFSPPPLLHFLNHRVYDLMLTNAPPTTVSDVPVLVGIDDRSLKNYGQWPWPRYRLAQLIQRLDEAGAKVVVLDMLMPEADRTSPEVITSERQRDFGSGSARNDSLSESTQSNDEMMAAALSQTTAVLSYKFLFSPEALAEEAGSSDPLPLKNLVVSQEAGAEPLWPLPVGVLNSIPILSKASAASGFTNVRADDDGVLRRAPLLMNSQAGYYPSLALAAVQLATGQEGLSVSRRSQEATLFWHGREIPLDNQGRLLLAYYGPETPFTYYSAAEILAGSLPAGSLDGKIAFVGAWASGLGDRHVTPFNRSTPGLAVHATIASNLLQGTFLQEPSWARGAELFFVLCLGLISTLLITRYGFFVDVLMVVFGSVLPLAGSLLLFNKSAIYISPVTPLLLLLVNCSFLGLVKYGIEVRKVYVRTRDLMVAQDTTILGMVFLSEARDEETGEHILRTQRYVEALARHLRTKDKYKRELAEEDIELLFKSAPLHDIGKVGIPDSILLKPAKLTDEEYEIMKTHPQIGAKALVSAMNPETHGQGVAYLDYARDVAISHHEKWDGSGYPNGLKGTEIPLAGRLMALADVYDALISKRVYKPAYPHEKAKAMIIEGRGTHFDPDVIDAFLANEEKFIEIASMFRDKHLEVAAAKD